MKEQHIKEITASDIHKAYTAVKNIDYDELDYTQHKIATIFRHFGESTIISRRNLLHWTAIPVREMTHITDALIAIGCLVEIERIDRGKNSTRRYDIVPDWIASV